MLQLVTLPDERLFKISAPVPQVNGELVKFLDTMVETMHEADGIGLAAVQVGRLERFFVIHIPDEEPRFFINPKIILFSDELVPYEEGCLSIPGIYSDVIRPDQVKISAIGRDGNEFTLEAEGLLARVIQHEYDHLDGQLFYQHLKDRQQVRFLKAYEREHQKDVSHLLKKGEA